MAIVAVADPARVSGRPGRRPVRRGAALRGRGRGRTGLEGTSEDAGVEGRLVGPRRGRAGQVVAALVCGAAARLAEKGGFLRLGVGPQRAENGSSVS
jgi:hypothetical protein